MPHAVIKLYAGKSEAEKASLAEEVTKALMASGHFSENSISVSIEDVPPEDWAETVYRPEILGKWDRVYKKPGYNPL